MTYISAEFDVQKLPAEPLDIKVDMAKADEVRKNDPVSLIRDEDTLMVISDELGYGMKPQSGDPSFRKGDIVYVPKFIAGLKADKTVTLPYVTIDGFMRISIL